MDNKGKSSAIVSKMFRSYIFASLITVLAVPIHEITDGILLSHAVAPEALSVISLLVPIGVSFTAVKSLFVAGASIFAARALGAREDLEASQYFTTSFIVNFFAVTILSLLGYCFLPEIAHFVCPDSSLYALLYPYMKVVLLLYPVEGVLSALNDYVRLSGRPKLVSVTTVVSCVANIPLTALFLFVFDFGIQGAAWATIICMVVTKIPYFFVLRGGAFPFRFVRIEIKKVVVLLKDSVRLGVPVAVMGLVTTFTFLFANKLVLSSQGASGMLLWSILIQVLALQNIVLLGSNNANYHIGGVLLGEDDYRGVRQLVGSNFKFMTIVVTFVVVVCLLFPDFVVSLYDGGSDLSVRNFRVAVLFLIPFFVANYINALFVLVERPKLSMVFSTMSLLSILLAAWVGPQIGENTFWLLLPLLQLLVNLVLLCYTYCYHRTHPDSSTFGLLPLMPNQVALRLTIGYSHSELARAVESINKFLNILELRQPYLSNVQHCCEELVSNVIEECADGKGEFEFTIVEKSESLLVLLKEMRQPFRPNYYLMGDSPNLKLIRAYAEELQYRFSNGVNITSMSFPLTQYRQ